MFRKQKGRKKIVVVGKIAEFVGETPFVKKEYLVSATLAAESATS